MSVFLLLYHLTLLCFTLFYSVLFLLYVCFTLLYSCFTLLYSAVFLLYSGLLCFTLLYSFFFLQGFDTICLRHKRWGTELEFFIGGRGKFKMRPSPLHQVICSKTAVKRSKAGYISGRGSFKSNAEQNRVKQGISGRGKLKMRPSPRHQENIQ